MFEGPGSTPSIALPPKNDILLEIKSSTYSFNLNRDEIVGAYMEYCGLTYFADSRES